ncbi:MAG: T9SS type A sorting domain-containing protein [Bacteroidetes bacterium]|nr:T9SS type A sorting domain-containing protein [Bacteroidota bacterium]
MLEEPIGDYKATLLATNGQLIQSYTLNEQSSTIDVSEIQSGAYIFVIEIDGQRFEKQVQIVK